MKKQEFLHFQKCWNAITAERNTAKTEAEKNAFQKSLDILYMYYYGLTEEFYKNAKRTKKRKAKNGNHKKQDPQKITITIEIE